MTIRTTVLKSKYEINTVSKSSIYYRYYTGIMLKISKEWEKETEI